MFEICSIIRTEEELHVFIELLQCFMQHMQGLTVEWVSVIQTENREGSTLWHMARATLILKKITRSYALLQSWVASETCNNNHSRSSAKAPFIVILISFALDPP